VRERVAPALATGCALVALVIGSTIGLAVSGTNRDDGDAALIAGARKIGFPLMVKASAGGGGRGMRLVQSAGELPEALQAGRREAKAGFGDDRMLLEKAIRPARHVEIQVLGDRHGEAVSLYERECSVQWRHQKVLEESPSPAVDAALRARMGEAAVKLCKAARYDNAGTVECLLDDGGNFSALRARLWKPPPAMAATLVRSVT
jgi:geranyl-CoA carboxylase alpha subunit